MQQCHHTKIQAANAGIGGVQKDGKEFNHLENVLFLAVGVIVSMVSNVCKRRFVGRVAPGFCGDSF
jgi:hypothetical protein